MFCIMDPIPRIAKLLFHGFGLASLILGLISAAYTFQAVPCVSNAVHLSAILFLVVSVFLGFAYLIKFFRAVVSDQFDSSDGRVVWSVYLLSCRLGFDSESRQTNDFKIVIHSFPA